MVPNLQGPLLCLPAPSAHHGKKQQAWCGGRTHVPTLAVPLQIHCLHFMCCFRFSSPNLSLRPTATDPWRVLDTSVALRQPPSLWPHLLPSPAVSPMKESLGSRTAFSPALHSPQQVPGPDYTGPTEAFFPLTASM